MDTPSESFEAYIIGKRSRNYFKHSSMRPIDHEFALSMMGRNIESVRDLLTQGANAHILDNDGKDMAMYAVMSGDLELVRLFLSIGLDVNFRNSYNETPLMYACMVGDYDIFVLLMDSGAAYDLKDSYGLTPMMHAAMNGHMEIAKHLVMLTGVDIETTDRASRTALILASQFRRYDMIDFLVECGANLDAVDRNQKTFVDYIPESHQCMIQKLVEYHRGGKTIKIAQ